jgi:hypothetical protein
MRNKLRCNKFSAKKNGDELRFQTQENQKLREMLSEQARENSKLQTESMYIFIVFMSKVEESAVWNVVNYRLFRSADILLGSSFQLS